MLRRDAIRILTRYQELFYKIQDLMGLKRSKKVYVEWGSFICSTDNDYSYMRVKFKSNSGHRGVIVYLNSSNSFKPNITGFGDSKLKLDLEKILSETDCCYDHWNTAKEEGKEGTLIRDCPFMGCLFNKGVNVVLLKE